MSTLKQPVFDHTSPISAADLVPWLGGRVAQDDMPLLAAVTLRGYSLPSKNTPFVLVGSTHDRLIWRIDPKGKALTARWTREGWSSKQVGHRWVSILARAITVYQPPAPPAPAAVTTEVLAQTAHSLPRIRPVPLPPPPMQQATLDVFGTIQIGAVAPPIPPHVVLDPHGEQWMRAAQSYALLQQNQRGHRITFFAEGEMWICTALETPREAPTMRAARLWATRPAAELPELPFWQPTPEQPYGPGSRVEVMLGPLVLIDLRRELWAPASLALRALQVFGLPDPG